MTHTPKRTENQQNPLMTLIILDINAIGRILALGEFTVLYYLLLWIFWCHYLTIDNVSCEKH